MSNNKQDHIVDTNKMVTAVEWLFNNYVDKGVITIEAIELSKLIEIDQMRAVHMMTYMDKDFDFEQYIKEHYEQDKQG